MVSSVDEVLLKGVEGTVHYCPSWESLCMIHSISFFFHFHVNTLPIQTASRWFTRQYLPEKDICKTIIPIHLMMQSRILSPQQHAEQSRAEQAIKMSYGFTQWDGLCYYLHRSISDSNLFPGRLKTIWELLSRGDRCRPLPRLLFRQWPPGLWVCWDTGERR